MEYQNESRKVTKLEERALQLRQTITTQQGKIQYLESDLNIKVKDIETLERKNKELLEEAHGTVVETANLQRHLQKAEADIKSNEEVKVQELKIYFDEFEEYKRL